jgi:hypothetical protein
MILKGRNMDEDTRNNLLELGAATNELAKKLGEAVGLLDQGRIEEVSERVSDACNAAAEIGRGIDRMLDGER